MVGISNQQSSRVGYRLAESMFWDEFLGDSNLMPNVAKVALLELVGGPCPSRKNDVKFLVGW